MPDSLNEKTYALFANPINRKLVADLHQTGARVFEFPPPKTEKIVLDELSSDKLKNLEQFDWLVFPDVLTVEYFLENLEENRIELFEIDFLRICALGEAVADRLRFAQIHADVIPSQKTSEKAYAALVDYIGETELKNTKFLMAIENASGGELNEKLIESGASVFELPIYRAKIENKLEVSKMKTLLENGAFDEFIFTAPTDFIWLEHYFKGRNLSDVFAKINISAADGVAFQAAREHKIGAVGLFQLDKLDKLSK